MGGGKRKNNCYIKSQFLILLDYQIDLGFQTVGIQNKFQKTQNSQKPKVQKQKQKDKTKKTKTIILKTYTNMKLILLFLAVLVSINMNCVVHGLYFNTAVGESRCFMEEVPEDTVVYTKYKVEMLDPQTNQYVEKDTVTLSAYVLDPKKNIVMDKEYSMKAKSFSFVSGFSGEYVICIVLKNNGYETKGRLHLQISDGEEAIDYLEIAREDKMDDLELRVKQVLSQIKQIQKEQNYQRYREARFRETSETTNWRVVYWSCIQLSILLLSGLWQMKHLKGFFKKKKLV